MKSFAILYDKIILMSRTNNIYEKTNIKTIAKLAGVSPSTVSRALNKDPSAPVKKTTKKILKIAKELNYYPNFLAKSLRQKKTQTIGVILNDENNPFYIEILKVIDEILNENNYSMVVCYSKWDINRERKNIITLLSKRVDGIIISPIDDKDENLKILFDNQIETVLIDSIPYYPNVSYVYTDNKEAAEIATEHLIKNGHKDILLFTITNKFSAVTHFEQGYLNILEKNKIKIKKELIVSTDELSIKSGYETFKKILTENSLKKNTHFTAVLTLSDLLAIGIYKIANELRIRIPDNFSIVGLDNIEVSSALTPPLTTIHQPKGKIGIESTNILLNNINSQERIIKKIRFKQYIIQRGSVRKLN